ncbi:DUF4147 domain-containing protein [Sinorhizobium meliloti]|nr:DUF4147 domain-containing protein [Sinorhizobium meliloti]
MRAQPSGAAKGRTIVVGAGKAASQMAPLSSALGRAACRRRRCPPTGHRECERIRVCNRLTRAGRGGACRRPRRSLETVVGLTADDLVWRSFPGGGLPLSYRPRPAGLT